MKFLMVVKIRAGRFVSYQNFEKESYDEVLKSIEEFPYNWKLEKVYEIAKEIKL